jgi:hypothetical protein
MYWGHINMQWELVNMSWESPIVSIKPLSMSKYTFTILAQTQQHSFLSINNIFLDLRDHGYNHWKDQSICNNNQWLRHIICKCVD